MKIWTSFYSFDHPWELVARAASRKYPNPLNTAVLGTDVIERKVVGGVLHSHKLVTSKWRFPRWAEVLIGYAKICYASEHSEVDPRRKHMVVRTRNFTFYNYIAVDETIRYTPHPDDEGKTLLVQEAVVTVRGVPLTSYMEELLTSTISGNAVKGRQAIEWIIDKLKVEVHEVDELIHQTRRQLEDFTTKTKRSMTDLQDAAIRSFDEIHSHSTSPQ